MGVFKFLRRRDGKSTEDVQEKEVLQETNMEEVLQLSRKISGTPFHRKYKSVELYLEESDFEKLQDMAHILELLEEQNDYLSIKKQVERLVDNKKALDVAAGKLEQVRMTLTQEILSFTQIVKEVGERYKLSPNWEGKKPLLVEKQKELERRKVEYEKNEQQLERCLAAFYTEYFELDKKMIEICDKIIEGK